MKYLRTIALLLIPPFILLVILYFPLIAHLNEFLLNNGNDSHRAYYTYMYYIRGGESWFHFSKMNYPYGENIFYLDANPLFLMFSRVLFTLFPSLLPYAVGVFNANMLVNVLLCYVFLFLVLRELGVNRFISVAGALAVTFLSPQFFKMAGNYSLAYYQYIPALMYFLLRYHHAKHWGNILVILVINLTSLLTHPYLGLMNLFFTGTYFLLLSFFSKGNFFSRLRHLSGMLLVTIIPAVCYILLIHITDIQSYRTGSPGGYMENYLPLYEFLVQPYGLTGLWTQALYPKENAGWFDAAYIPFAFLCLIVPATIYAAGKIKTIGLPRSFWLLLSAAFIVLLFATGLFGLTKFAWLYEKLPYARQFRFVNRFAWVFYYTATVFSVVVMGRVWQNSVYRKNVLALLAFAWMGYVLADIAVIHRAFVHRLTQTKNFYAMQYLSEEEKQFFSSFHPGNFQFILPLPFPYEGSFRYAGPYSETATVESYKYAWHTGLPLMGGILIRPDEKKAEWVRQAVNLPVYSSPLYDDLKPVGDVLLVGDHAAFSGPDSLYFSRGSHLFSTHQLWVSALSLAEFTYNSACDTVYKYRLMTTDTCLYANAADVVLLGFDEHTSPMAHGGKGALSCRRGDLTVLYTIQPGSLKPGRYQASCWIYNRNENAVNGCFIVQQLNGDGSPGQWISFSNPARSEIIHDGWSYTSVSFIIEEVGGYAISLVAYDHADKNFVADDLMIRPDQAVYIQPFTGGIIYNSHILNCSELP